MGADLRASNDPLADIDERRSGGLLETHEQELDESAERLSYLPPPGSFHDVLTTEEVTNRDGLIDAIVEGAYVQPSRTRAAEGPTPATRPNGAAGD